MSDMRARVWVDKNGWLWELFAHDGGDPWVLCKRYYRTQREAFDAACERLEAMADADSYRIYH